MADTSTKKINAQGFEEDDVEKNKVIAGLSYLNPLLGFMQMKKSKFVKFHINQILTLIIPSIIIGFIGTLIPVIFKPAPPEPTGNLSDAFSGAANAANSAMGTIMVVYIILGVLAIPVFVMASMNMLAALKGEAKRIPLFGGFTIIPNSNDIEGSVAGFEFDKLKNIQMPKNIKLPSIGQSIQCKNCGSRITMGKKFCPNCGTPAPTQEITTVKCPECGTENNKGYKFCSECGAKPVVEITTVKCPECGTENAKDYKFCNNCGAKPVAKSTTVKCPECGTENAIEYKFCNNCGAKPV